MRTLAVFTILALALTVIAGLRPQRELNVDDREVAGRLWLDPVAPRVGEPVQLRMVLFERVRAVLLNEDGRVRVPLPYESPRGGDTVIGVLQPTGRAGEYVTNLAYTEPGLRWIKIYLEGPEGRLALRSAFWVFGAEESPEEPVPEWLAVVVDPEAGREAGLPSWLEPATYVAIIVVIGAELAIIFWSLAIARRQQRLAA